MKPRKPSRWLVGAALLIAAAQLPAQETVRPEIGKSLQAVAELIKNGKHKEALAKMREPDAVANKSAAESLLVERMRIAAASGAGDMDTAARSFETLAASGKLAPTEKARMAESIAGGYYRAKDYGRAVQWCQRYFKEGGTSPAIRTLLIQSQYLAGDYTGATKELTAETQAVERAGDRPSEERLKLLLSAAQQSKDNAAYVYAIERMVVHHPKKEYWAELLNRLRRQPGFSDRLTLDAYRLARATGGLETAADTMEMAQLALQAEQPNEAHKVVEQGFASGVLGQGTEGERHRRLKDLVAKRLEAHRAGAAEAMRQAEADKDGSALVRAGLDRFHAGAAAEGVALMKRGIAKGGLKRPDDARLQLGSAQLLSGDAAGAKATLKAVAGTDGAADLARLWLLYASRKA